MTPARFMEEISRWIDENHYNKVDEKCDDSGKGTKKRQIPNCLGICLNHLWEMII